MGVNIKKQLKKFAPHFIEARTSALNEADTVNRLRHFFVEVLGYDPMQDVSAEAQMKGKFVDMVLKIDGRIRILVEAKSADTKLRDRHIDQAQLYASQNNYRWVILTNGIDWTLYHLTFEEGIEYETAFEVALDNEAKFDEACKYLGLLHKQSVSKGGLDAFWDKATAMCASSIGRVLFSESVLALLRRELRRDTGLLIDQEDLAKSIHDMLSTDAREQIGPLRIRRKRKAAKPKAGKSSEAKPLVTDDAVISDESPTESPTEPPTEPPSAAEIP